MVWKGLEEREIRGRETCQRERGAMGLQRAGKERRCQTAGCSGEQNHWCGGAVREGEGRGKLGGSGLR